MSGWGWLSGLQSHKTGTVLTSPLFTEWSVQPRGCWLENNKCCYWWLGPKQDIANACPSLSNYCSLWALDSDKPIATPSIHWSIYPAVLFALLLNWEKKIQGANIKKYVGMMTDIQNVSCEWVCQVEKIKPYGWTQPWCTCVFCPHTLLDQVTAQSCHESSVPTHVSWC